MYGSSGFFDFLGPIMAIVGALIVFFIILALALYLYTSFALMAIAKRTKTANAWLAFIPIVNVYLMTQVAKQSGWWMFAILLPWIPVVGSLALLAVMVFLWWKIAERLHRPGWWAILLVIPVVNLVFLGVMAWGRK
jgi:hypothetical protein